MHSSYAINNYADVFRTIVSASQPTNCVELGTLEGYSAVAIARGLKENFEKFGGRGHLACFDLFEDYAYRHSTLEEVRKNLEEAGVSDFVTVKKQDAYTVHELYEPNSIHLLHVDLSNTGETVRKIIELWDDRMVVGGIILFEGGSEERDNIPWMKDYKAPSIKEELEKNLTVELKYVFGTYFKYPGLTHLLKKR